MEDNMENKTWKAFGVYESYEEADLKRKELLNTHQLVKVRKFGKDGCEYKIVFWNEPLKKVKQKSSHKTKARNFKKGKKQEC